MDKIMSSQNLQDGFLNNARKDRVPVAIYLTSGVKLSGRVKGFDKYCVVFETNHQEQLIFKHAISTVVTSKQAQYGSGPLRSSEVHDGPESQRPSPEPLGPKTALGIPEPVLNRG